MGPPAETALLGQGEAARDRARIASQQGAQRVIRLNDLALEARDCHLCDGELDLGLVYIELRQRPLFEAGLNDPQAVAPAATVRSEMASRASRSRSNR